MKWGNRSQGELTLPVGRWVDNAKALDAGKRTSVGKDRPLFKQGKCLICEIPLAGYIAITAGPHGNRWHRIIRA